MGHKVKFLFNYKIKIPINLVLMYACLVLTARLSLVSLSYSNFSFDISDFRYLSEYLSDLLACIFTKWNPLLCRNKV